MAERDEELVQHEEEAAASEAGAIGGRAPDEADPERRPVDDAGGGEAEGFEDAEAALIDHAEHGAGEGTPRPEQMGEEAEIDPSVHGQADSPGPQER